jgi:proteasome lid subunit RPN8/RPN11
MTVEPTQPRSTTDPIPLLLGPGERERLAAWIEAGYPHETCGLLVGRPGAKGVEVVRVEQARNLNTERARDRYTLSPEDQLRSERDARADGLEIVGIWHSHPDHPARPSETDRVAAWEGWSYLIVRVTARGAEDFRSWRLDGEAFVEQSIAETLS